MFSDRFYVHPTEVQLHVQRCESEEVYEVRPLSNCDNHDHQTQAQDQKDIQKITEWLAVWG